MRYLAEIAAATTLSFTQTTAPTMATTSASVKTLTSEQVRLVEQGVSRGLRDPESIRMGDIFAAAISPSKLLVCGFVNAKNGYGGYTGEVPFFGTLLVDPPIFFVTMIGDDRAGAIVVTESCNEGGVNLRPHYRK